MMKDFLLLPEPRHILFSNGILTLSADRLVVLDSADPQALRFTAARLQQALRDCAGLTWEVFASTAVPQEQAGITLSVVPEGVRHPQGYELTITEEGIHVVASTHAGIFYAVMTLIQILEQRIRDLPTLRIRDWPDFPNRGVMLDISRDKVPTMETLFDLVDLLASWKANQLQLYMEHTFAYRNHPEVWAEASPLTGEEVLALDAYSGERFVELVPCQNSFSHMRRWLVHDRYHHLAECPEGRETRWGYLDEPLSLCPLDPGSLEIEPRLLEGKDEDGRSFRIFFAFNHTDRQAEPQFRITAPQGEYTATEIVTGQPVPCRHRNGRLELGKPLEPGEIWVVKIVASVAP